MGDEETTRAADLEELHVLFTRGAELVVLEGPDVGLSTRVAPAAAATIGSGRGCDLRLSDALVSRLHVTVQGSARGVKLVDRGSRNGTYYRGARLTEIVVNGDVEINLGDTRVAVRADGNTVGLPYSRRTSFGSAVAHSEAMRHVFRVLEMAAPKDVTILLEGESGTGKEVLATSIHAESARRDGPFVVVDCGSIAPGLVESELFGHERGAFTGAVATHQGAFERAHGGTIFLDELGELPLEAQPKLLRALESRTIRRVGGREPFGFDLRVVAATNRQLKDAVRRKEFREDLFYRLAVVHVVVPRLAERREDVVPLAERFLRQSTSDPAAVVPDDLARLLVAYDWPGNVRELRNVVDRFATFRQNDPNLLFGRARTHFDAYHRAVLPRVIAECGGAVPKAAERLGMSRTNLYRVLHELGADVVADDA